MKLTVFNGSPRGTDSNTQILLDRFLEGFSETPVNEYEIVYLNHVNQQAEFVKKFSKAESVILALPMYVDAMPGMVKTFIESLSTLKNTESNPPVAFIVQYGFMETIHGRTIGRYLAKLAKRLNSPFKGLVIRGAIEGIKIQPPVMTKKLFELFRELGRGYGITGEFDPETVKKLTRRERHNMMGRMVIKMMHVLKLGDLYWDQMMKQNGVYNKRWDKPSLD